MFPSGRLCSPPSSSPTGPGTKAQRVQPAAQLARTVSQPHPQRAAHAPERHLPRLLPAAAQWQRRQQQRRRRRRRRRRRLFPHFSQFPLPFLSSQQRYLPQLSCQLGALQSIPTPRYAKLTHVPGPRKYARLLFFLSCFCCVTQAAKSKDSQTHVSEELR